jgi:predicted N-acetyltransferase YhbS
MEAYENRTDALTNAAWERLPESAAGWKAVNVLTIPRKFGNRATSRYSRGQRMETTVRDYKRDADYEKVGRFLVRTYRTAGDHINWLQPRWEYMHYHPLIRRVDLDPIGIWEAAGKIVGVIHPEHRTGTVYVEVDQAYPHLKRDILEYAEEHLAAESDGVRSLRVYINDSDNTLRQIAGQMGYERTDGHETMSLRSTSGLPRTASLPEGFHLKSLADENNLHKVHRVLWRGFGHGPDPPEDEVEDRRFMQSAPNYRKDLNIVVEAPDGNFVAYCGMWYEPVHRVSYVEPVATDPDFRRLGLGQAAVLEGVRRCGAEGATVAYVGSSMRFYQALGFEQMYRLSLWQREW